MFYLHQCCLKAPIHFALKHPGPDSSFQFVSRRGTPGKSRTGLNSFESKFAAGRHRPCPITRPPPSEGSVSRHSSPCRHFWDSSWRASGWIWFLMPPRTLEVASVAMISGLTTAGGSCRRTPPTAPVIPRCSCSRVAASYMVRAVSVMPCRRYTLGKLYCLVLTSSSVINPFNLVSLYN